MKHQISVGRTYLSQFLFRRSRKFFKKFLQSSYIPSSQVQYIMFTVRIHHGKRQLIIIILSFQRFYFYIGEKIFRPSATPLIIKSQMIILHAVCKLRPKSILLCDQKNSRIAFLNNRIQMFQKLHSLEIFIRAIKIWSPLSCLSSKIQIQHGIYIIQAKSIYMELIQPEKCIREKKILNHRASIIIKHRPPHRMDRHSRILNFIKRCSIKFLQSCIKSWKLCRCPVQDHTNSFLVKFFHQSTEICRCSKTIRQRKIR